MGESVAIQQCLLEECVHSLVSQEHDPLFEAVVPPITLAISRSGHQILLKPEESVKRLKLPELHFLVKSCCSMPLENSQIMTTNAEDMFLVSTADVDRVL